MPARAVGSLAGLPVGEQPRTGTRSFSRCRAQLRPDALRPRLARRLNSALDTASEICPAEGRLLLKDVVSGRLVGGGVRGRSAATGATGVFAASPGPVPPLCLASVALCAVGLLIQLLSLIHISEPTRLGMISYA